MSYFIDVRAFFHPLNHAGHVSLQKEGLFGEHIIRGGKITKDYKPIKYALSQDLQLISQTQKMWSPAAKKMNYIYFYCWFIYSFNLL